VSGQQRECREAQGGTTRKCDRWVRLALVEVARGAIRTKGSALLGRLFLYTFLMFLNREKVCRQFSGRFPQTFALSIACDRLSSGIRLVVPSLA
jgi:hypothetical protein